MFDPDGQLKAKVIADRDLGNQIGLQHTPTIFVIGNGGAATPAVEVDDYAEIGQIIAGHAPESACRPRRAKKAAPKEGAGKENSSADQLDNITLKIKTPSSRRAFFIAIYSDQRGALRFMPACLSLPTSTTNSS